MGLIERIIEAKVSRYGIFLLALAVISAAFTAGFALNILRYAKDSLNTKLGTAPLGSFLWNSGLPEILDNVLLLGFFGFLVWVSARLLGDLLLPYIIQPFYQWCRYFLRKDKEIRKIGSISGWIFQGSLKIQQVQPHRSLEITSSNSGALIKRPLYRDFAMSFEAVIKNGGGFAILFRAQNLENYLMLQIGIRDQYCKKHQYSNHIQITPHIRFLGNFETFNINNSEPYYPTSLLVGDESISKCHCSDMILPLESRLSVWLRVKRCGVILCIKGQMSEWQQFLWNIPTHTEPNIIQRPKDMGGSKLPDDRFTSELWFRNRYGRIGFRAWGLEKATVYDLCIREA